MLFLHIIEVRDLQIIKGVCVHAYVFINSVYILSKVINIGCIYNKYDTIKYAKYLTPL